MLLKPLLVCLCVVVWLLLLECFLVLQKLLLVRLWVVVWVLFCGVFLGVAQTIVGLPMFRYVGIVLWSVYWCCRNHCWFACVLLSGYCFVECFLVLQKPLLVGLCVLVWLLFCGVFLSVSEIIVGLPVCCYVGLVLWSVSWCCENHCWFACVLLCGYCSVSFKFFVLRHLMITQSLIIARRKLD